VEPERGARSAAAQNERPSDERQEVLRLHMPQVGLGWPHKNAGEDTPARPSCLRPHATNVPKSVNLFCAWDAPFCEPGLGRLGSVVSRRPRQTQGNAVAPAQVDRRQSDQMALAGVRGGQRLPRSSRRAAFLRIASAEAWSFGVASDRRFETSRRDIFEHRLLVFLERVRSGVTPGNRTCRS
jgi:hypothetical protein